MAAPTLTAASNFSYSDGYWDRNQSAYDASKLPAACGPAGAVVKLTGTNLSTTTAVRFGSAPAASFAVISGTEVHAVVPVTTVGSDTVTVTTPDGEASATYTVGFWGPWVTPPGSQTSDVSDDSLTSGGYQLTTTVTGTSPPDPTGTTSYTASGDGPILDIQCVDGTPTYDWSMQLTLALLYWFFTPTDASPTELAAPHSLMTRVSQVEFEEAGGHADGPATITLHPGGSGSYQDATVTDPTGGPVPAPFTNLVQYRQLDPDDYYMTTVGGTFPHLTVDEWPDPTFLASKTVIAEAPIAADSSELSYGPGDFATHPEIDCVGVGGPDVTIEVPLDQLGPAPGAEFSSVTFCVVGMFDTYLDGSFTVPDSTDPDLGAVEHLQSIFDPILDGTILYQPSRYRILFDRPLTPPPTVRQRQIPGQVRQRQMGSVVRQRQIPR